MTDVKINSFRFIIVELFLIAAVIWTTYYLTYLTYSNTGKATLSTTILQSSTITSSSTTSTTTINYTAMGPYLTQNDMQTLYGTGSNAIYRAEYCDPYSKNVSSFCNSIAFFGPRGSFKGWSVQYKSNGLNINEVLLVNNSNSSTIYDSIIGSIYPNPATDNYPSNLIINATYGNVLFSVQYGKSYSNIYVLKGNYSAFVYINGANYSQNYTIPTIIEVSKRI